MIEGIRAGWLVLVQGVQDL